MSAQTLGDVALIDFGFPFQSSRFLTSGEGIPLARGDNVAQGYLRMEDAKLWPRDAPADSKYLLAPGDVVLAMDRPWVGAGLKQSVIRAEHVPALLVQRVARLRPKPDATTAGYLAAIIRDAAFSDYLVAVQTGSAVPHISGRQIAEFPLVGVPPLPEQQAIAEVLGALDDKIAANTHLAATADELALQTFRSLPKPNARPLSSTASFINGKAFTKNASGAGRLVVRIAELNNGPSGSTVYSDAAVETKHVPRRGDILLAWSGSLTLHRWFRDEAIVNQHIFKVVPSDEHPRWLIYELLRNKLADFKSIAADKATTMGHIQRHHLDEPVPAPSEVDVRRVQLQMDSLWCAALNAEVENLTLTATRDTLLPKLMSGELRVRDAENIASAAGARSASIHDSTITTSEKAGP